MRLVRLLLPRRLGPTGVALSVYDVWRRVPAKQRRRLVAQGRRHGLRIATRAWAVIAGTMGR